MIDTPAGAQRPTHPANRLLRWFNVAHQQDPAIIAVGLECQKLAQVMDAMLPESAEKTAGLRKLLEAKDCFVRARIEAMPAKPLPPKPNYEQG